MTSITIQLPDEKAHALRQTAISLGNTVEEYAARQLIGIIDSADAEEEDAATYRLIHQIVEENTELYKRLA